MAGDGSAYAALGLEPGADTAAIEQAYRRLIKQHHPDREGGDGAKAAEINRAYRELRDARPSDRPTVLEKPIAVAPRLRWGWTAIALLLIAGIMAAPWLFDAPLLPPPGFGVAATKIQHAANRIGPPPDMMDQPLQLAVIDGSVRQALQLARHGDEMALANASRDCHRALRSHANLTQFDHCAAFDDTVVQLEDRDPLRDQGPFSEIAVTGRIWSAATALSSDSLSIDARLDRIRQRVEWQLATSGQPTAPHHG